MISLSELNEAKRILEDDMYAIRRYYMDPSSKQETILNAIEHKGWVTVSSPRQEGITTALIMAIVRELIKGNNKYFVAASYNFDSASRIMQEVVGVLKQLPKALGLEIITHNRSRLELSNGCVLTVSGSTSIINVMRGRTLSGVFIDLADYVKNLEEVICAFMPAMSASYNSKFVLATTHEGCVKDSDFVKIEKNAIMHRNRFTSLRVR